MPPYDTRISLGEQDGHDRQYLQDVYPLAPQQWLVKKKGSKGNENESLLWNKGYPEMGVAEDTNEGKNLWISCISVH